MAVRPAVRGAKAGACAWSQQFRDFIGFDVEDVDGASPLQSVLKAIIHPDDW